MDTFQITSEFAKICIKHKLENDQILKNLNTHTYLSDGHYAILSQDEVFNQHLQKEIDPKIQKDPKILEWATKTIVPHRYGPKDKNFKFSDWSTLDFSKIVDDHYRMRVLHSPLSFHLSELNRVQLNKLMVYDNSMSERLVSELKKENLKSKPKLKKITSSLTLDTRIESIRARIEARKEYVYDNNRNVIRPPEKKQRIEK